MDEDTIFLEALQRSDRQDRVVFLDEACAGNEKLRASVEQLLAAYAKAGSFLLGQAEGLTDTIGHPCVSAGVTEQPGTQIGPYTLVEQIGEGGFGVVFMAEQQQPVRRQVALKIIKPGMDTREVIARFEAERQALALMDHPNVARVLDAGTTGSSRPFFVMELVRGVPITEYCDEKRLTPRQRLEIVLSVCLAIQHAHQKGIIHRDIKPTNILVAEYDRQPIPKVIDFGVAKAVGPPLTERTMFTGPGQIVGTLEYMSPEQAQVNQLDVDTRSDIYSLGVLLYELLTGSTPFDKKRLRSASWDESLRIIREEDPPKPSMRLSECARQGRVAAVGHEQRPPAALASIAAARSTEPARLPRLLCGELDWIVMKALEKDRSRRYQSAGDLAADLRRHLSDEPVLARPPSSSYRLSKLIRRNKGQFAAAVLTLVALVAALVLLMVSNAAIRAEQVRTGQERTRALSAKRLAESAQRVAERHASDMRKGVQDLQAANQLLERGRVFIAEQRWDDAEAAFSRAIELRPEYAALWRERGELYRRLGLFELAVRDVDNAHRLQEPAQGWMWRNHALLLRNVADDEGYRELASRMRVRFHGTSNYVLAMETILASTWAPKSEDEAAIDVELARSIVGTDPRNAWFHYGLGVALYRAKDYEAAVQELSIALEGGADWNARRICYPVLAMAQHRLGRSQQAKESLQQAGRALHEWTLVRYESLSGNWAVHMGAVGEWPILWWDWLECQLMCEEASLLITGSRPEEDNLLRVLRARALAGLRRTAGAMAEYEAAIAVGPDSPQLRCEMHRTRAYYFGYRDWKQAADEFARARELCLSDYHLWGLEAVSHLAAGDAQAYRQLCAQMQAEFAATQDPHAANEVVFAVVLLPDASPDWSQLARLARTAARLHQGNDRVVGAALYRAGNYNEAIKHLENSARFYRPRAWEWCFRALAHHQCGNQGEARRCLEEARRWIAEADRQSRVDLATQTPLWDGFLERFEFPLLYREAEAVLSRPSPDSSQPVEGQSGVAVEVAGHR